MSRSHRTDTSFFVVVIAIMVGAVLWAGRSNQPTLAPAPETANGQEAPASPTSAAQPQSWAGELVLVRNQRTVVGVGANGAERAIYQAPESYTIATTSPMVDGKLHIRLTGADDGGRVDVVTMADAVVQAHAYTVGALWAPRPGTSDRATVRFSNAERDFGSTVELVQGSDQTPLYATSVPVSALAWRADGEVLAIGVQQSVVLVQVSAGDSRTVELGGAIQSLSWRSGALEALTTAGAFVLPNADAPAATTLSLSGTVSRDLIAIGEQQYAWLTGEGNQAAVVIQTLGSNPILTKLQASRLVGVAQ